MTGKNWEESAFAKEFPPGAIRIMAHASDIATEQANKSRKTAAKVGELLD